MPCYYALAMMFSFPGLGLQKNSEFRDLFNCGLLKLESSGLIRKLEHIWLQNNQPRSGTVLDNDSAVSLGYYNLAFPFLTFAIGIGLALFISCHEKFLSMKNDKLYE